MTEEDGKKFITLPELGAVTEQRAEAYIQKEAKLSADMRRRNVDELLLNCGFAPLKKHSDQPLNRIVACLQELELLDESGGVLNSSEATLRTGGKSDIYFLGLNPGGEAGQDFSIFNRFPTIYESLAFSRLGVSGWDQDWSRKDATYEPGQAPIQRRFKHIARFLGLDYGEILATNLVFARSRRFKALQSVEEQIETCLEVHKIMLDVVKPKRLWVMGNTNSAGQALKLGQDVEWRDADYSNWSIGHGTVEFCGHAMTFCHTPHLTFWDATADDKQKLLAFAFHGRGT